LADAFYFPAKIKKEVSLLKPFQTTKLEAGRELDERICEAPPNQPEN